MLVQLWIMFEDENGKWLALMVWGSACYHLRPRDEYIVRNVLQGRELDPARHDEGLHARQPTGMRLLRPKDDPKTIWVAPFVRDAVELLNSPNLPDECLEGAHGH